MANTVIMPRQGQSVESCIISEWSKKVGDKVSVGDVLFSYETDKSSFEEKAEVEGTILAILAENGDDVPCLAPVCIIGEEGEDITGLTSGNPAPAAIAEVEKKAEAKAAPAPVAVAKANVDAKIVIMPRQGQSVESCVISEWSKKVGDKVAVGDVLFSYETDKSSFEEKSEYEGTMLAILAESGDDVPCLNPVCIIGKEGEDISSLLTGADTPAEEVKTEAKISTVTVAATAVSTSGDSKDLKISPRAKNLALRTSADLLKATATGPEGRIIERDVVSLLDRGLTVSASVLEEYIKNGKVIDGTGPNGKVMIDDLAAKPVQQPAAKVEKATAPVAEEVEYEDVKLTNIRKVIAKSMQASLSTMAQLTLNASFDATQLMAYRATLKANAEALGLANITLNDMVLFAVAKTLEGHKDLNAHFLDDKMRYFKNVNLGIACDTPRGLLVPTVFKAEKLTLNELAKQSKAVINEAKGGTISPDKLKGASFTVTNLGSMGIESFTPVVNPPQTGILGVCAVTRRIKTVGGNDVSYPAMGLSLTFDHRALDGAPAAKFLKELCSNLENFNLLLAK